MSHRGEDPRPDAADAVTVPVDSARLVWIVFVVCFVAELLLVVLDYHVNYGRLTDIGAVRRFSNIAREDSLASWFGTTQTLLSAVTLWLLFLTARFQGASPWSRAGWLFLALFVTYMAVDDGAQVHERLGTAYSVILERSHPEALAFFPSYAWQIIFVPLLAACGCGMLVFLWRELPLLHQRVLVVAALGCLVLAVGLDFVEGLEPDHPWNLNRILSGDSPALEAWSLQRFGQGAFDTFDHFSKSLEEFLEMVANTLLWVVFLRQLTLMTSELRVRFSAGH